MPLNIEIDLEELNAAMIRRWMAMDDKCIAFGSPSGCIKIFSRKNLNQEEVFHASVPVLC